MLHTSKLSCSVTKFSHKRTSRTIKGVFTPVGIRQALKKRMNVLYFRAGEKDPVYSDILHWSSLHSYMYCCGNMGKKRVKERKWESEREKMGENITKRFFPFPLQNKNVSINSNAAIVTSTSTSGNITTVCGDDCNNNTQCCIHFITSTAHCHPYIWSLHTGSTLQFGLSLLKCLHSAVKENTWKYSQTCWLCFHCMLS